MKLRLGTRGSDLATTQSNWVKGELAKAGVDAELIVISTSGDRSTAPTFGAIGPQGVFVREIEQALIASEIDLAVHSYKDLPTQSPDGLVIAAVPARRDVADWLFLRDETRGHENWGQSPFSEGKRALTPIPIPLPPNATVGTSSARRQAWLRHARPDLKVGPLRGNVPTRLKRVADGDFDAILLAGAGIERLTEATNALDGVLDNVTRKRLDPREFVPAPAQGALAVQCRADDDAIRKVLAGLDDNATRQCVDLERRALALAEGGCDSAFGAYAERTPGGFELSVMVERDGSIVSARVIGADATGLEHEAMNRLLPADEVTV
jgi:hydroxymethylbilane synthase